MLRLSDALQSIITENPLFLFGLSHRLMNLSQLAHHIKPLIEVRTKKSVKDSAVLMSLSRLQRQLNKIEKQITPFHFERLTITSDLCSMSFHKNPAIHSKINRLFQRIEEKKGYITISEGINEITLLFEKTFMEDAEKMIGEKPKKISRDLASIAIHYHEKYNTIPGMLYQIIQQIALQNINVVEIASTHTAFILYVEQKDVKLTFDTLYQAFGTAK